MFGTLWDQCISYWRAERNFHMSTLAANEVLKPTPSLSLTFTLQPPSVSLALTASMPFHTVLPFLAPKILCFAASVT